MIKNAAGKLLLLMLIGAASVHAQGLVPISALAQHLVARNYLGVSANGQPTGQGSAALYVPFMYGIPAEYMFCSTTVQNQTTATFTAVFTQFQIINQTTNGEMSDTFFAPGLQVEYYYHASCNSSQDWTNFASFQAGQLVAKITVTENMISAIGDISYIVDSGPLSYSADFTLPDGNTYNFRRLVPGGLTVHILSSQTPVTSGGNPVVVPVPLLNNGAGGPAIMVPFSGSAVAQSAQREINIF